MKKTAWAWMPLDAVFVALLLLLDQASKSFALASLELGKSVLLGSFGGVSLSLTLTTNEGAAWGFFTGHPWLLLGIRLFFVCFILFFYLRSVRLSLFRFSLLAILAGALGNIVDFFLYGHVVDMVHVIFWGWDYPVFNFADACIFVGCLGFLWESLKKEA